MEEETKVKKKTTRTTNKTSEEKVTTRKPRVRKTIKKEDNIEIVKKSIEFSLIEVIVIVLITGIVVSVASGFIVYKNYDKLNTNTTIVTSEDELKEIYENYNKIVNNYVKDVNRQELIEAAIEGMYSYLDDDFSMYLDKDDSSDLEEQLNGEYTGVGIEITTLEDEKTKNSYIKINRVFKDSPAEKSGLKAGDIILKVDGKDMKDANEVASTIKKGNKDSYEITYKRDGVEKTLTLKREKVFINSVTGEEHGNVGYIKIDTFSSTTKAQLLDVLDGFSKNITSVVIDLRDNTGGYLDTAYNVSDLFLERGKVIYQLKDRNEKITKYRAENGVYRKFNKIVVLINESSASASEILTLALKESAGAKVVGVKSYGKGTVQETGTLDSGSMIKYTISYWLSPNGNSINKTGIKPDIEVKDTEKQKDEAIKAAK